MGRRLDTQTIRELRRIPLRRLYQTRLTAEAIRDRYIMAEMQPVVEIINEAMQRIKELDNG